MSLPTLIIPLRRRNPNWKPIYEDGNGRPVNMSDWQIEMPTEVEVVQLNLNTGGMRVRYVTPNDEMKKGYEVHSVDVSIDHFFNKFDIVEKV
jgi:hypothetical protein